MAPNELYQFSLVNALMDGVANHGLPLTTLLTHGDHGLGTFRHMHGEMIILNGAIYQMNSDATVIPINPSTTISPSPLDPTPRAMVAPFAQTTFFKPRASVQREVKSKDQLAQIYEELLPKAKNLHVAIRMRGRFRNIKVRTVDGQIEPRESLRHIGKRQTTQSIEDGIEGTVFGFRSPEYSQGISVAGDHLHFLSEDKTKGGHVLAIASEGEVLVEVAPLSRMLVEVPVDDDDFNEATLVGDHEGIRRVEGDGE